jgi:hypothetical protein
MPTSTAPSWANIAAQLAGNTRHITEVEDERVRHSNHIEQAEVVFEAHREEHATVEGVAQPEEQRSHNIYL